MSLKRWVADQFNWFFQQMFEVKNMYRYEIEITTKTVVSVNDHSFEEACSELLATMPAVPGASEPSFKMLNADPIEELDDDLIVEEDDDDDFGIPHDAEEFGVSVDESLSPKGMDKAEIAAGLRDPD